MGDYHGSGTLPRHVDRKALYTDLEARVRYLQQFIGFTAGQSPRILVPAIFPRPRKTEHCR